jgi:predicted RNA-binding protein with PIN domain
MGPQFLIVDGHSVIFAWPNLRALHQHKTALARERLIKVLTEYQDYTGINVVVVFDGTGPAISEETVPGGIQVFYSNTGRTADDLIERLVAKYGDLYSITVATSDLLEQQTALAFGGNCISADGLRSLVDEASRNFAREMKRRKKEAR